MRIHRTISLGATSVVLAAGIVAGVQAQTQAEDSPKNCNQYGVGRVCVGWYAPTHTLQAWFYNNSGGGNWVNVQLYKQQSGSDFLLDATGRQYVAYGETGDDAHTKLADKQCGSYYGKFITDSGNTGTSGTITFCA